MEKILVTGGAGFIASHVVEAYLAEGHEVVVLDNLSTGTAENVPENVKFYEADITDAEAVRRVIEAERPTIINHHAAHIQVGYSVENPQFDATSNVLGTLNIMQAAKEVGGVKKVIMASTGGAIYGDKEIPFNEDMSPQPLSPYGISKRSAELYLYFYYAQYGIQYMALRYSNVYGPRQNPHGESGVIAIFMEMMHQGKSPKINGEGTNSRDYVYVADVARANVLALAYNGVGEFNIGTGVETSTNEVFRKVVAAMNVNVPEEHGPARPGEQVRSVLNAAKAQRELGWSPTVMIDEGIALTVASMQA